MLKQLRQWYAGKDIPVNPDEPDSIGGMRVLHETKKEFHWSAKIFRSFVSFYFHHWQWLWGTAIAVFIGIATIILQK